MKIGIMTFYFSDNFGAALQAYALRKWFLDHGHDARFVEYLPTHVEHGGKLSLVPTRKAMIGNAKSLYLRLTHLRTRLFGNAAQRESFESFRRVQLGASGSVMRHLADLNAADDDHDLLVCGSDQIWSPSLQFGLDPAYFLNFGSDRTRRISYAPSFGNAALPDLKAAGASKLISRLDSISVRESSGLRLVEEICGRQATQVVDPTALLDSYDEIIKPPSDVPENYIFCYALRTDDGVRESANQLSSLTGLPVITPKNAHSRWAPIGRICHPGPGEWLGLIRNSRYVVTNSFHGTMFSLLLNKPFVVAAIPGKKAGLNDRMISLLEAAGLGDRLVSCHDEKTVRKLHDTPIDWAAVNQRLATMRASSEQFLENEIALAAR
ncbi:MAG: polysaccharide pyruvyl transferase family protein [Luteolibacter sp.]